MFVSRFTEFLKSLHDIFVTYELNHLTCESNHITLGSNLEFLRNLWINS